jgi:hypothetical protein
VFWVIEKGTFFQYFFFVKKKEKTLVVYLKSVVSLCLLSLQKGLVSVKRRQATLSHCSSIKKNPFFFVLVFEKKNR